MKIEKNHWEAETVTVKGVYNIRMFRFLAFFYIHIYIFSITVLPIFHRYFDKKSFRDEIRGTSPAEREYFSQSPPSISRVKLNDFSYLAFEKSAKRCLRGAVAKWPSKLRGKAWLAGVYNELLRIGLTAIYIYLPLRTCASRNPTNVDLRFWNICSVSRLHVTSNNAQVTRVTF